MSKPTQNVLHPIQHTMFSRTHAEPVWLQKISNSKSETTAITWRRTDFISRDNTVTFDRNIWNSTIGSFMSYSYRFSANPLVFLLTWLTCYISQFALFLPIRSRFRLYCQFQGPRGKFLIEKWKANRNDLFKAINYWGSRMITLGKYWKCTAD